MHEDDRQIGRLLTRREALRLLGGAGVVLLTGCWGEPDEEAPPAAPATAASASTPAVPPTATGEPATTAPPAAEVPAETALPVETALLEVTMAPEVAAATATVALPSCIVRPEQMEGPYFVDAQLERSDIRSDPADGSVVEGAPLRLTFRVSQVGADSCMLLPGVLVDVWQCDAQGVYSGVRDMSGRFDTAESLFLRGAQTTDEQGSATFTTIYPGWYPGRTVHIHFKIRTDPEAAVGHEFTSQLYFDDALTDEVHTQAPYTRSGQNRTRNEQDGLYRNGGEQLLLDVMADGEGYAATFDIGLVMV